MRISAPSRSTTPAIRTVGNGRIGTGRLAGGGGSTGAEGTVGPVGPGGPGLAGATGGGTGRWATSTCANATAVLPFAWVTSIWTRWSPAVANDHVTSGPEASSNAPSPSRSQAVAVIEPCDGLEVDLKLTCRP